MLSMNIEEVREQIPLLARTVYLDSAGAGPPPRSVYESMRSFLDEWSNYGEKWDTWLLEIVRARELFARLVSAKTKEVACIPNVTSGLAAVASALRIESEQNVVVSDLNFPTNVYIWHSMKQRGLISEVRVVKAENGQVPLSDFEKAIDDNTAAVSLDYVSWINGCREDIPEVTQIAHSHGALMLVDAFHAVGVIPVDVHKIGVDVLTCGTYKWLMGPHGTAFLYVNREILEQLEPSIVGWHGISDSVVARAVANEDTFGRPFDLSKVEPATNATKFEWGTWSVISVVGAKAALEFALKYSPEDREPLIGKLTDRLLDGLRGRTRRVTSPLDKERRSGIVTFEVDSAGKVARRLHEEGVVVAPRVNTLRVSPHFFNTEKEIDVLLEKI
jgi:selenocysteine lyase/cysteine desulfurase